MAPLSSSSNDISFQNNQSLLFQNPTYLHPSDGPLGKDLLRLLFQLSLETRFAFNNGSHKYKLNRETYEIVQSERSMSEYYTSMKCVWEDLDSTNELPRIFLNGLDDHFSNQISQLRLNSPLPSVETACALLQQEESRRGVFGSGQLGVESTALDSKGEVKEKCTICRYKWHPPDKCWGKLGYPT
ncbi:hypothetical protein CTI12_AA343890 [Artemisia annua]|uniref:Retrotransposon gag domain-containing protein n=1 Tax=Artemisia annua TaxID=35608 RepID=A0A2U1MUB9_ARTAN|nr:hypothetical protein CTI12_AA343890 [Artemisia annua]